jgi:hypothetical protein
MNPSNTGHGRQNPSVISKKKPDSEEEDKEEEDGEEEDKEEKEDIATELDSKEVSHVHIGTDACDHSKQGLESENPVGTLPDGYVFTNPLPQISTKQSVWTTRERYLNDRCN